MNASSQHNAKQHIRAILISNEVAPIDILARYPVYRILHPVIKLNKLLLHHSGQMMLLSMRY
jgi:hypothetical protein